MIVVKLMGGLGNQMFQYAFSRELAKMYGEEVCYDIDSYATDKQRNLALYNLNVPNLLNWRDYFSETERARICKEQKKYRVLQRAMRAIHHSDRVGEGLYKWYLKKGRYYNFDPYFYSLPILSTPVKVAYGYFQGEPYFRDVIDEVKQKFSISMPIAEESELLERIKACNAICIHLRVGDYKNAKNRRFDVLTPEYVQRGINYIKERIKDPVFFVFTNDQNAVKEQFKLQDLIYIYGFKDYQDMRLMLSCKHFIISNSTFSWWISYLSENPDKIVIVPKKWRNNQEAEPALMETNNIRYVRL